MPENDKTTVLPEYPALLLQDLIAENEALREKINTEFGGTLSSAKSSLPPEIENQFLRSVYAFESMDRENIPKVPISKKIGDAVFKRADSMSDEELHQELKKLVGTLYKHHVILNTVTEYDERIIYEFILNELFPYEIENIDIPGYFCHFCYEDFHPNHEYDLRRHTNEFVEQSIKKSLHEKYNDLYNIVISKTGDALSPEEAFFRIKRSYLDFSKLELNKMEIEKVAIDETAALVEFFIDYDGYLPNDEKVNLQGKATLQFTKDYGEFWYISKINMPGMEV
jgi:hypothetical protein